MKYFDSKKLSETQFNRYRGISCPTFDLMVEQLKMLVSAKGRPPKLSIEDKILLCLSYWRECRTLFHVETSWLWHYNHERLHQANKGSPPLMAA